MSFHRLLCSGRPIWFLLSFLTFVWLGGVWSLGPRLSPTWRIYLLVWVITLDLSGKGDPRQHNSRDHLTALAPLLHHIRDIVVGDARIVEVNIPWYCMCKHSVMVTVCC